MIFIVRKELKNLNFLKKKIKLEFDQSINTLETALFVNELTNQSNSLIWLAFISFTVGIWLVVLFIH